MTRNEIQNLQIGPVSNEWEAAFRLFEKRFDDRYFSQIKVLQTNPTTKHTCGFLITSIDCILIETLEQFYEGEDEIKLTNKSYFNFFERADELKGVFKDHTDAGKFFGLVRSGLLHQAKTKQGSVINIKKDTPIIRWVNEDNKSEGFEINRNLFHECVVNQYANYIVALRQDNNEQLRKNFKKKLLTIY